MNRAEKRLAAALGVEWVRIYPGGLVEVCYGGPGCGCGDEGRAHGARSAPSTARGRSDDRPPSSPGAAFGLGA